MINKKIALMLGMIIACSNVTLARNNSTSSTTSPNTSTSTEQSTSSESSTNDSTSQSSSNESSASNSSSQSSSNKSNKDKVSTEQSTSSDSNTSDSTSQSSSNKTNKDKDKDTDKVSKKQSASSESNTSDSTSQSSLGKSNKDKDKEKDKDADKVSKEQASQEKKMLKIDLNDKKQATINKQLEESIKDGKNLVITDSKEFPSISLIITNEAAKDLSTANKDKEISTGLQPISAEVAEEISVTNKENELELIQGTSFNLDLNENTKVSEPLQISFDLPKSKQDFDVNKISLIQYKFDANGRLIFVKLGGTYDDKQHCFTTNVVANGNYALAKVDDLTKITLDPEKASVITDGEEQPLEAQTQVVNDQIMVPLKVTAENLGATLKWNEQLKQIEIQMDQNTTTIDTKNETNDFVLINGTAFVSTEFLTKKLSVSVLITPSTNTVEITK